MKFLEDWARLLHPYRWWLALSALTVGLTFQSLAPQLALRSSQTVFMSAFWAAWLVVSWAWGLACIPLWFHPEKEVFDVEICAQR